MWKDASADRGTRAIGAGSDFEGSLERIGRQARPGESDHDGGVFRRDRNCGGSGRLPPRVTVAFCARDHAASRRIGIDLGNAEPAGRGPPTSVSRSGAARIAAPRSRAPGRDGALHVLDLQVGRGRPAPIGKNPEPIIVVLLIDNGESARYAPDSTDGAELSPRILDAIKAGASDAIGTPSGDLLASVARALDPAGRTPALATQVEPAAHRFADLTPRQREIMDLVLAGYPSKIIAADLRISQRTVENHRASIMRKTGAKSLPALVRLAMVAGQIGSVA